MRMASAAAACHCCTVVFVRAADERVRHCRCCRAGVVVEVCRDVPAWPGRHLLEDGGHRRYFGLRTAERRVVEFECRSQREYEMWTKGVARLLSVAVERKRLA